MKFKMKKDILVVGNSFKFDWFIKERILIVFYDYVINIIV